MTPALLGLVGVIITAIITAILGPIIVEWFKNRKNRVPNLSDVPAELTTIPNVTTSSSTEKQTPHDNGFKVGTTPKEYGLDYPSYLEVSELPNLLPWPFLREESPLAMSRMIAAVPPLKRSSIARELFWGKWVHWAGSVLNIRADDQCYVIQVNHEKGGTLSLTFPPSRLHELEALRVGDHLLFEGQVRRADPELPELVYVNILKHEAPSGAEAQERQGHTSA